VLLAVATAGASEVTGSLLVFALLVAPAATAMRLTARPATGIALSVLIAVAVTWIGESIAFFSPYPIGFWVTTLAFGLFLAAVFYRTVADRLRNRRFAPVQLPVGG
jgi:zinc/manganese transport system permease protein